MKVAHPVTIRWYRRIKEERREKIECIRVHERRQKIKTHLGPYLQSQRINVVNNKLDLLTIGMYVKL